MQEDLAFALAGGRPQIMAGSGATMSAKVVEGMGLLVTVWVGDDAIITFGVAGDRSSSPGLWRRVHEERLLGPGFGPAATDRDNPPRTPWVLERHEPGILHHPLQNDRIAAFEHCAAWAWLARQYELAAVKNTR
jgi:hypothetical protein